METERKIIEFANNPLNVILRILYGMTDLTLIELNKDERRWANSHLFEFISVRCKKRLSDSWSFCGTRRNLLARRRLIENRSAVRKFALGYNILAGTISPFRRRSIISVEMCRYGAFLGRLNDSVSAINRESAEQRHTDRTAPSAEIARRKVMSAVWINAFNLFALFFSFSLSFITAPSNCARRGIISPDRAHLPSFGLAISNTTLSLSLSLSRFFFLLYREIIAHQGA